MVATFYGHFAILFLKWEWWQGEFCESRMKQPYCAYPAVSIQRQTRLGGDLKEGRLLLRPRRHEALFSACSLCNYSPLRSWETFERVVIFHWRMVASAYPADQATERGGHSFVTFCYAFFLKFHLLMWLHSSWCASPTTSKTFQNDITKHHEWVADPLCTRELMEQPVPLCYTRWQQLYMTWIFTML